MLFFPFFFFLLSELFTWPDTWTWILSIFRFPLRIWFPWKLVTHWHGCSSSYGEQTHERVTTTSLILPLAMLNYSNISRKTWIQISSLYCSSSQTLKVSAELTCVFTIAGWKGNRLRSGSLGHLIWKSVLVETPSEYRTRTAGKGLWVWLLKMIMVSSGRTKWLIE